MTRPPRDYWDKDQTRLENAYLQRDELQRQLDRQRLATHLLVMVCIILVILLSINILT